MSGAVRQGRGQPLIVLGALLLGWVGARATSFTGAEATTLPDQVLAITPAVGAEAPQTAFADAGPQSYPAYAPESALAPPGPMPVYMAGPARPQVVTILVPQANAVPQANGWGQGAAPGGDYAPARLSPATLTHLAGEYPPNQPFRPRARDLDSLPDATIDPPDTSYGGRRPGLGIPLLDGPLTRLAGNSKHWSSDAWAVLRKDVRQPTSGLYPATYGASQTGAVIRYRLSLRDPHKTSAYLRTTSTLGLPRDLRESTMALGVSARPFSEIPIVAAAEGRLTQQNKRWRVQPAVLAVTELRPLALPYKLRAEAYAQGGYVGGQYATLFADGQIRIDRALFSIKGFEARLGGGTWGGIQRGAARLDAGPGATLALPLGRGMFGKVGIDWRFRVLGEAQPGSGPAITLGTGF